MEINSTQWWAIGIGAVAVLVLFWDQIRKLFSKVPDILPDDEPDNDQVDLEDFRALNRLDDRAERLASEKLMAAVNAVKASFFGG